MDTLTRKGEKSPFLFFPQNLKTKSLNPLSKEYLEEYPKEYLEKANPLSKENLPEHPKEYLLTYYRTI